MFMEIWFWLIFFTLGLVLLGVCSYFLIRIFSDLQSVCGGAPFVGAPLKVAREALKLAAVSKDDIFFDLGCGDGRVLKLAIQGFGVKKAVGYEIGTWPYLKFKIQNSKLSEIKIYRKNLFEANLKEATVIFLYLYPQLLEKLKPKLKNELSEKARVIVVTWGFVHPFGKPYLEKIIPWQPQPFKISVFQKGQI